MTHLLLTRFHPITRLAFYNSPANNLSKLMLTVLYYKTINSSDVNLSGKATRQCPRRRRLLLLTPLSGEA
jgi:hypothetical protein